MIKKFNEFVNECFKEFDHKTKEWVVMYADETKSKSFKKKEDADTFMKKAKKEAKKKEEEK
jgi:hypothetical protein